jgi:hypothetical protein
LVAGFAEQNAAPVVDELRNVERPVDVGDLTEDGFQKVIEDDLAVEVDDQIVDGGTTVEVAADIRASSLVNDGSYHIASFL